MSFLLFSFIVLLFSLITLGPFEIESALIEHDAVQEAAGIISSLSSSSSPPFLPPPLSASKFFIYVLCSDRSSRRDTWAGAESIRGVGARYLLFLSLPFSSFLSEMIFSFLSLYSFYK